MGAAGADKAYAGNRPPGRMRTRFRISLFATALAASAAAHALLFATFRTIHVGQVNLPTEVAEMAVHFEATPPEPEPEPNEFDIGQPLATGYATHDLEGRREQAAPEAPQDQASLSLDPVGTAARVEVPSSPGQEAPTAPLEVTAPPPALVAEAIPPMPAPPALPREVAEQVERDRLESIVDVVPVPPPVDAVAAAQSSPLEVAVPSPPEETFAAAGAGADPAPKSDSESDAFSVLGTVEFRAGRVTVRSGRQVKTRRPKIGLAGMVDLAHSRRAQVELKVAVDESGKVTNVDVARSSGSNEIDQPCRVAMYDWWFEPKKDAAGRAVPDVFQFTIAFR